jgi:transcription initiation factor TFIIF subunit alpha
VPPVKYNFIDADEAEERFEKRNKTLNYFSVMLSRRLKDSEEGEEGVAGVKEVVSKEKNKPLADSGLVCV